MDSKSNQAPPPDIGAGSDDEKVRRVNVKVSMTLLVVIYTFAFIDRMILNILQEPIKIELGVSDARMGLLSGLAFSLLYVGLGIPMARVAERRSRKAIISASIFIWSVMTILCGQAASFMSLFLARVGVGVGEAGVSPPAHSLISDYFPPSRRSTALAIYGLGVPLGMLFGAAMGGYIAQLFGWRAAFAIVGAPGIILAIAAFLFLSEPPRGMSDAAKTTGDSPPPTMHQVLQSLWFTKSIRNVIIAISLSSFASFGIGAFAASFFIRNYGLDLSTVGLILGFTGGFGAAIGTLTGGWVADWAGRLDRRWYVLAPAISSLIAAPLCAVAFLVSTWQMSAVLLMIAGGLAYVGFGPSFAIVHNMVPARMRATSSAMMLFSMNMVGLGLGPFLVGTMSDAIGSGSMVLPSGMTGSYHALCTNAALRATQETLDLACQNALSFGVRWALVVCSLAYAGAGLFYIRSSWTLRSDMQT